jgi:hypothetical protein
LGEWNISDSADSLCHNETIGGVGKLNAPAWALIHHSLLNSCSSRPGRSSDDAKPSPDFRLPQHHRFAAMNLDVGGRKMNLFLLQ